MARECERHDGDAMDPEECEACRAYCDGEAAYWLTHFGGLSAIKATLANEKFYRDDLGIDITDPSPETVEKLRGLK